MRAPRSPVVDWNTWRGKAACGAPCVDELRHGQITSSGRAALFHALRELNLKPGDQVLVPTYHCPTMIAPVVALGLTPRFYPIGLDGLPDLHSGAFLDTDRPSALIVAHYFGFGRSLSNIRQWCDRERVPLIEDCAHALVGWAGERPIGQWGDLATASLTKFLPVSEAGWLASASRPISLPPPVPTSLFRELRGINAILERSISAGRLIGLGWAVQFVARLRGTMVEHQASEPNAEPGTGPQVPAVDLTRVHESATRLSGWLRRSIPRGELVKRRQANYDLFAEHTTKLRGAKALIPQRNRDAVPYVFPVLVDEPEKIYQRLRHQGIAVLRWDRVWPGTPKFPDDTGAYWSKHLLQFLCHQDLTSDDVASACRSLRRALEEQHP